MLILINDWSDYAFGTDSTRYVNGLTFDLPTLKTNIGVHLCMCSVWVISPITYFGFFLLILILITQLPLLLELRLLQEHVDECDL